MFKHNHLNSRVLFWTLLVIIVVYSGIASIKIIKWQLYTWLPQYWSDQLNSQPRLAENEHHIIFTMVDHYEPGENALESVKNNEEWLKKYEPVAQEIRDSYGNPFKYTWFYAYDQANDQVMRRLSQSVYAGLGEIELHWHHPQYDNKTFDKELEQAISWFKQYGAMVSRPLPAKAQFAFIHGNWALDASTEKCNVTSEISLLQKHGGYMDMTFSTIGVNAQPVNFINRLYYVEDSPQAKSYDKGVEVEANKPVDNKFLIFQGPMGFNWKLEIEYGAVESYSLPTRERVEKWFDANIHVKNKPEWTFIKVYSHGIQSSDIVSDHLTEMLQYLLAVSSERNSKLHFMTAREAYNVVKAAEAGLQGDPELYRDFLIAPPLNTVLPIDSILTMNKPASKMKL